MSVSAPTPKLDRYIVIHVATTCDEHGVYVTKDSAEVIELGWILLDTKTCEEVCFIQLRSQLIGMLNAGMVLTPDQSCTANPSSSSPSTRPLPPSAVSLLCHVYLFNGHLRVQWLTAS